MAIVAPIFVSHGEPTLALDRARGVELADWARSMRRPRAVLVVSAHWQAPVLTRGSTRARPDLAGCPRELAGLSYAPPASSELAYELASLLPLERSARAWDHGVFGPLVHMFPEADVPVLQLSLVAGATPRALYALGRRVGPLAERGVLIMGSGNLVSPAAPKDPRADAPPADFARGLDAWVASQLADAEMDALLSYRKLAPEARRAHPTSEHIDPLFFVAGAASIHDHAVGFPVRGFDHGTRSRRCVQFGR